MVGVCRTTGRNKYRSIFKYICACGTQKVARGNDLVAGKIVSCGCRRSVLFKEINEKKRKHVHSGFSFLWQSYKCGAKKRNLDFLLTKEQFKQITSSLCRYCGSPPSSTRKTRYKHAVYGYKYNGIDRIDNKLGYYIENCVPCCGTCNVMKLDYDVNAFLNHCKKISDYCFVV